MKLLVVAVAPFASVAVTVNEKSPAIVGVPVITPAVLRARPAGNEPVAANVLLPAPPLAEIVKVLNTEL